MSRRKPVITTRHLAMIGTQLALVAVAGTVLMMVVALGLVMNRSARSGEAVLIENAISSAVDRTLSEQKALALWDGARAKLDKPMLDGAWFDREIGAYVTEGYGHDAIFILDRADRPIYGYAHGARLPAAAFETLRPALRAMLRETRTGRPSGYRRRDIATRQRQLRYNLLQGARYARWSAHLISTPNGPAIVAVMTVADPAIAADPATAPLMVDVVQVDNPWFATIGRAINLPDLRIHLDAPAGSPIADDAGHRIGTLSWRGRQPGDVLITRVLPILAVLIVLALVGAIRVIRRLSHAHQQLTDQEAQARLLAMHDALSGLPNRRHFMDELTHRLKARANDPARPPVGVAYLDVDRFKDVNDVIGHAAGDALVQQIGPRIAAVLGPGDLLARLGGDEFAVIAALDPARDADALGRALLSAFDQPFAIASAPLSVTASIGIATAAGGEIDPNRPIQDADISLYRAKDDGRGRYAIFAEEMAADVRERHAIETDLRTAIGTPAISMRYQPIFSVRSNAVTAVEALVRWDHPTRGPVSPALFIPVAEKAGLMPALGNDIIGRVLQDAAGLKQVDIAVNLSPRQLQDPLFPETLEKKVRAHRVDPARLVLEVTETALIGSDMVVDEVLGDLRRRGFRLALDDFGTGCSSLSHLQRFEFDKIKIDRSFVTAGGMEKHRPIIQAIVTIGRGFEMEIVAEGIETAAEFAFVQSLGVHAVQGYWLAKPLPFKEARSFLKKRAAELARLEPSPLEFGEAA